MAKKLKAHITHLEMRQAVYKPVYLPTKPKVALLEVGHMPVPFYHYLYEQVGKPHHWFERRKINDKELDKIINAETTLIEVLYADGCPAGFFELDFSRLNENPAITEIVYFGLAPQYHGLKLGKWFLAQAIARAWRGLADQAPDKITIHTNTLDHPAALMLYQKMGFTVVGTSEETVTAWEE